jgi:hypothetical protein
LWFGWKERMAREGGGSREIWNTVVTDVELWKVGFK